MTDYRCDHGYYAMGRDCPTCQKEQEEARKECAPEEARTRLQKAERERDEARKELMEKHHEQVMDNVRRKEAEQRLEQATALLREVRWDLGDVDGLPQDEYNCLLRRIDAFIAGQPAPKSLRVRHADGEDIAPVTPVVDDAMVFRLCAELHYRGYNIGKQNMRAALVAALEGRT